MLSFCGNLVGGSFGNGQPGGVDIFLGFSYNRSVWVKTRAALGEEGFCERLWLQNRACERRTSLSVFNFVAGNATKIGVSELFFQRKVRHPYLRNALLELSCCDLKI